MAGTDPTLTDEGFEVLPPETQPPTGLDALSIEDTLATTAIDTPDQLPPAALGRTPAIDFIQQAFIPRTAGAPLMLYGLDTLRQWIEKCCRTRRGENPACDPDFGLDRLFTDLLDGDVWDEGAAAEFEGIVERGLSVHPFIDSIDDWQMDYVEGDDAATMSFIAIPVAEGEDPLDIDVQLPATGVPNA